MQLSRHDIRPNHLNFGLELNLERTFEIFER